MSVNTKKPQGNEAQAKKQAGKFFDKNVAKQKTTILFRNGRFHEWEECCRDRIATGPKTTWMVLWDRPRRLPKPLSLAKRLQMARDANDYADSDEDTVEENEEVDDEAMMAALKKDVSKARVEELERIRVQTIEVFGDLYAHLSHDMKAVVHMHADWLEVRTTWDVIKLLEIIEDRVSGHVHTSTAAARDQAELELANLKQRINQSVSQFADDVRAAYLKLHRYLDENEPPISEARKLQTLIRGMNSSHNEYKKSFYDRQRYNDVHLPVSINELVEDIYEFERDRAAIDKKAGLQPHNSGNPPLAVHSAKSGEPRTAKPTDKCFQCNGTGHFKRDCPQRTAKQNGEGKVGSLKIVDQYGAVDELSEIECAHTRTEKSMPRWVYLDSGAETSVFCNRDLVEDIHEGPQVVVRTVAGSKKVNQWAHFGPIKVLFDPECGSNLLSQHDLEEASESIEFTPGVCWSSTLKDTEQVLEFHKYKYDELGGPNKFYCLVPTMEADVLHSTVEERERNFSKAEVEAARGVRQLKLRLAGASDIDMIKFLRDGVAVGCPFTPEDVRRAARIYGPDIGTLKGKTTDSGPSKALLLDIDELPSEQKNQRLYIDIFEVESQRFILAVLKPLKYRLCAILDGKSSAHVETAMKTIMSIVESRGFQVTRIEVDPEKTLLGLETVLGIPVDVVGAGKHVATAEREGRVVKERARLIMASLPYILPARLVKYLVLFVVTRLNLMPKPSDGSSMSPRERFTGRKLIFKKNLELGFGEFAEVWAKPDKPSSMEPRTISAIALYPVGNEHGAWYFYDVVSCSVIQRAQWKVLPTPGALITMMNQLANEDFVLLGKGVSPKLSKVSVTMGGVPLDRMIVNPNIEVPRYGPDGTPLQPIAHARKRRGSGTAPPEPLASLGGVDQTETTVIDEDEIETHEPFQNDYVDVLPDEHDDDEEQDDIEVEADSNEEPLGYQVVDGLRKSLRIRDRAPRVFQMSVRESVKKLGDAAIQAIQKEFAQMRTMEVFVPIHLQDLNEVERKKIIHSSAFVKEKTDEEGRIVAIKARWVASGNEMDKTLRTVQGLEVDMNAYVEDCLEWFGAKGVANTPAEGNLFDNSADQNPLSGPERERFHTAVAKLLYLSKRCRPDILTAVSHLTGRVQGCTEQDMAKLTRVFKFLNKTKTMSLKFAGGKGKLEIQSYVDAAYGVHDTGESRSGLVVTINGSPVLWKSSKQAIVTKSSTEAELVALTDGSTDIIWLRQMLNAQGFDIGPVK
eukprot:gene17646-12635_t